MSCGCPICKNMAKKRGGDGDNTLVDLENGASQDADNSFVDLEQGADNAGTDIAQVTDNEVEAADNEYNSLDEAEKGNAGTNVVGGTRRRKRRGSRKTKKSGKKTRRKTRKGKRTHRR